MEVALVTDPGCNCTILTLRWGAAAIEYVHSMLDVFTCEVFIPLGLRVLVSGQLVKVNTGQCDELTPEVEAGHLAPKNSFSIVRRR